MASYNKFIGIGRLGRDPEIRYMPSGDAMATFSLAFSENWKDAQGNKKEKTTWINCKMFGKVAEIAGQYLKKGSLIQIEGSIGVDEYADKATGEKRYSTYIKANSMQMLDTKPTDSQQPAPQRQAPRQQHSAPSFDNLDDEIPF